MKVVEETPVTFAEAKEIMENLEKEREELGYEQKITLDFFKSCVNVSVEDVRKAREELKKEIPELKDHQIVMILNILPENEEDVKIIFAKERMELDDAKIKKILEIVDKIRPEERITYKPFGASRKEEKSEEESESENGEEQKEEESG